MIGEIYEKNCIYKDFLWYHIGVCTRYTRKNKEIRMIIAYVLMAIELLAIFLMLTALVYTMYALYQYTAYGVKVISKDLKE